MCQPGSLHLNPACAPANLTKSPTLLEMRSNFSPSRGVITIKLYRDGKNCVAAIRDQGPGVVSSELATIFEPFRRGSEGKSRTGAGLGLAISRALIEAHCGKIWVESEVGRGSIFYLSLPLATLPILESTE